MSARGKSLHKKLQKTKKSWRKGGGNNRNEEKVFEQRFVCEAEREADKIYSFKSIIFVSFGRC